MNSQEALTTINTVIDDNESVPALCERKCRQWNGSSWVFIPVKCNWDASEFKDITPFGYLRNVFEPLPLVVLSWEAVGTSLSSWDMFLEIDKQRIFYWNMRGWLRWIGVQRDKPHRVYLRDELGGGVSALDHCRELIISTSLVKLDRVHVNWDILKDATKINYASVHKLTSVNKPASVDWSDRKEHEEFALCELQKANTIYNIFPHELLRIVYDFVFYAAFQEVFC